MNVLRASLSPDPAGNLLDLLPWGENPTVPRRSSDLDPAFDPVAERIADVGRHLRETRQQRGEDLYDIADYLRIKPSYLFALEDGDLKAMPGRAYAMGFLRTYADHLGYDGAEVVRGLNSTTRTPGGGPLKVPSPAPENRLPSLSVVAAALVLAGVTYGGWFAVQSGDEVFARIKAVPGEIGQYAASLFDDEAVARQDEPAAAGPGASPGSDTPVAALTPLPPAVTAGAPVVAAPATGTDSLPAGSRVSQTATANATQPGATQPGATQAAVAATAAIEPPAAPLAARPDDALASLVLDAETERTAATRRLSDERPDGGSAGELLAGLQSGPAATDEAAATAPVTSETGRVVLLAREASWIQVQSPSRDFLRSTTLEPGQRFELPDRGDLALWTGNAGGVEIWVDGQSIGVLGRSGAVMRDVSLAPDALIARR
jgi:cytoskeleton protein RodZ